MGFKVCLLLAATFSHTLVIPVMCGNTLPDVDEQKNYYPPGSPHHSRHMRSSSGKSDCPTPPLKGSSSSHGGSYGAPPSHGRNGSCSSSPKGGSYNGAPPSHVSSGSGSSSPKGGSHYGPPPSHGSKGSSVPAPTVPPLTPIPAISTPPSLLHPTPNIFPGTCDFWRTHPALIWALLGCWGSLAHLFGFPTTTFFGGNPTVPQALANTRNDGYGALLREGTAAYLNSLRGGGFPLTTQLVREQLDAALVSEYNAVEDQAERFRLANEGHVK